MSNLMQADAAVLAADSDEDVIDLRALWRVIDQYKWAILGLTGLVGLLTLMVVFAMTPIYQSTASILVEANTAKVVSIEEVYGMPSTANKEYYQTQFEILKSRSLIERLVDKMQLDKHVEFNPDQQETGEKGFSLMGLFSTSTAVQDPVEAERAKRDRIVQAVTGRLTVSPIRNSQLVNVGFEAQDPKLAADMANELARLYIESDLEGRLKMTQQATAWLSERLDVLRTNLTESERKLQSYRDKEGLVDVEGVNKLESQQISELTPKLVEARQRRINAEKLYAQVKALKGKPASAYETISTVLSNPLVQTLKGSVSEAQRKVSEMAQSYGDKHPKMQAAQADLHSAQARFSEAVQSVVAGIVKEYEMAQSAESSLESLRQGSKEQLQQINRKSYQLNAFEREVEANQKLYDLFLNRMKETSAAMGGIEKANARVVDPAVPAQVPSKPKKKLIVLLSMVLTLFVGVMLAFLLDHLDNTFKGIQDVEDRLGLSVLGTLHRIGKGNAERSDMLRQFIENPQGEYAEAMRSIRTGVVLSGLDNPHKVLVVTSSIPGEGKTTLSTNLAVALGQMEKVLLIDADMRRPTIRKNLGLDAGVKGLSDLVAGTVTLNDCIYELPGTASVHLIPSGTIPPNPLELLSSKRFAEVLANLEKHYGRIVIDSAPVLPVSDARVLSSYANAMIYVIKADQTQINSVIDGVKQLRQVSAPLVGVVLNQVEEKKSGYYGRYGKYGYGYRYGYGYSSSKAG